MNRTAEIGGWLFDLYPRDTFMVLWIRDGDGALTRLEEPFHPRFYARGERKTLLVLLEALRKAGGVAGCRWTRKRDFWSGDEVEVLEVETSGPADYARLPGFLSRWEEKALFYNCDLPLPQAYLYEKGVFPTGRCFIEAEGHHVAAVRPDPSESVWDGDGTLPDLRVMELYTDGSPVPIEGEAFLSKRGWQSLILECEGYRVEMEDVDPREVARFVGRFDPDLVLSDGGDSCLLPFLSAWERRWKAAIPWDRDPSPPARAFNPSGRSYFSYGRTCYRAPAHPFFGRWHIDRRNSFLYAESGLEGVLELARLAKIPVQRMARTSPGTAISSMQMDQAVQDGLLIPWRKGEPERFKTAWDLLMADKGGLVFQPRLGLFEDVAEIDFASMYPSIMVMHNLSPETVLCPCCENRRVPESGYTVCERREGIVPRTLKPLLERRTRLKKKVREMERGMGNGECGKNRQAEQGAGQEEKGEAPEGIENHVSYSAALHAQYDRRQTALKWVMVTCFGYLGYRNARFGRIEAHEAVTAFGREKLLQAKEICEEEGFSLLHGLTDSLWVRRRGLTEEEVLGICRRVTEATGVTMSLEGLYRWMVFLPSKGNPESPVANRYFGLFRNGKIKARGLAFRRSDTPPFIGEAQLRMLDLLAETEDGEGYRAAVPGILDLLLEYVLRLKEGGVAREALAVARTITREPGTYRVDSPTALASQQLQAAGLAIHPGERVLYLIRDARARDKDSRVSPFPLVGPDDGYDEEAYIEMLLKATEEILVPLGWDVRRLREFAEGNLGGPVPPPLFKGRRGRAPHGPRIPRRGP